MNISKEVKVGVFVLIAGVLFYTGFNFLKGIDFFSTTNTYYVHYKNVDGLTTSNPVVYSGLAVGRVSHIDILNDNTFRIKFDVDQKLILGDSANVTIVSAGLLSGKTLRLYLGNSKKPIKNKSTVLGLVETDMLGSLTGKAGPMMDNINSITTRVNEVVNDENQKKITNLLTNLEAISISLKTITTTNEQKLSSTLSQIELLTKNIILTEKKLAPILNNVTQITDNLSKNEINQTVNNLNQSIGKLNTLLNDVQAGKGTLGKFATDDSLYVNLNKSAKNLDLLLVDFRMKPKKYVHFSVFGKK